MSQVEFDWGCVANSYDSLYQWSIKRPDQFWRSLWDYGNVIGEAGSRIVEDLEKVPGAKWFPDARLNYAENLLRYRDDEHGIVFHREDSRKTRMTSAELYDNVARLAAAMRSMGITEGDRVVTYMPNIPETLIAMLATTSIGAIFSSCSPDFGVTGVVDRFGQIEPKLFFTIDKYLYNGKQFDASKKAATILESLPSVEKVVLVEYLEHSSENLALNRAVLWDEFSDASASEVVFNRVPFNHPLFILFSSGTTGPPKCIVHGVGGTLINHLREHLLHNDVHDGDSVFGFTTTGWMMWNWLVSTLACGANFVMYDGSPTYPTTSRLFEVIEEVGATIFATSAKFVDACKKEGLKPREENDLSKLKTMLTSGSTLVPECYDYLYQDVSKQMRVSSVSGGTDICGCFVMGSPVLPVRRGEIQCLALGMKVEVFDDNGQPVKQQKGELVCSNSFPSMPVSFWKDEGDKKYHAAYFEKFPNVWCHGDFAEITEHNGMIIYGRSDTVLNPSGVRIGTAEIYNEVEKIPEILEACVIGQDWENDTRVVLFVRLIEGLELSEGLQQNIRKMIRKNTTSRHVPAKIVAVDDIPKTTNGKIVELAVRNVVHNYPVKNMSALANPEALEIYRQMPELQSA